MSSASCGGSETTADADVPTAATAASTSDNESASTGEVPNAHATAYTVSTQELLSNVLFDTASSTAGH